MKGILSFVSHAELKVIVLDLAKRHNLQLLVFRGMLENGDICTVDELPELIDIRHLFLVPNDQPQTNPIAFRSIRPGEWDWISVFIGGVTSNEGGTVLLLSQIVGGLSQKNKRNNSNTWLKALRARLKCQLYSGVRGLDGTTGRISVYPAIFYTESALKILAAGGVWKQFINARPIFIPLNLME